MVEETGRDLPAERFDRVAVLLDQGEAVLRVEGHDGHRARVFNEVAAHEPGDAEVDNVPAHIPDEPAVDDLGGDHGTRIEPVKQIRGVGVRVGVRVGAGFGFGERPSHSGSAWSRGGSTSTRRLARWASRAAPMSPANSGCARLGRDLNSGCA